MRWRRWRTDRWHSHRTAKEAETNEQDEVAAKLRRELWERGQGDDTRAPAVPERSSRPNRADRAKRKLKKHGKEHGRRDMNPDNDHNWVVRCTHCGSELGSTETLDLVDGHFQQEHPGEGIAVNIVWAGVGPDPRKRTQRRKRF